jgi:hypothetical protein
MRATIAHDVAFPPFLLQPQRQAPGDTLDVPVLAFDSKYGKVHTATGRSFAHDLTLWFSGGRRSGPFAATGC